MSSSVASHDAEFLTPAMRYRRALTELDGMGRVIMKLEHRWNKNLKKWTAAAVKVQALALGVGERRKIAVLVERRRVARLVDVKVKEALQHLRWKRYAECLATAEAVLELDPASFAARRLRGHTYVATQHFTQAIEEYTGALEEEADDTEVRLGRARCYLKLNQWDSAEEDLYELMRLEPVNPDHWRLRGTVRARLHRWPGAVDDLSKCIELGDHSADAYLRRGMAEASAQRWAAAEQSGSEALRAAAAEEARAGGGGPRTVRAHCLRGRVRMCARQWDKAEEDFNAALAFDPNAAEALAGMEVLSIPHLPLPLVD